MGNFHSRYNPARGLSEQVQYLRDLSPIDKRRAMIILGEDLITKANVPLDNALDNPRTLLAKDQYDLLIQKCYEDICSGKFNEKYLKIIIAGLIAGLPERVRMDEQIVEQAEFQAVITGIPEQVKIDKMGVETAVEHLILLASRMVKGEECLWCQEEYTSPTRGSAELHQQFARALKKLDEISHELGLQWTMNDKSQFALDRLGTIHPHCYGPVLHLLEHGTCRVDPENKLYQTMWCHNNKNSYDDEEGTVFKCTCHCWDNAMRRSHIKVCYWGEHGDGSYQVYE